MLFDQLLARSTILEDRLAGFFSLPLVQLPAAYRQPEHLLALDLSMLPSKLEAFAAAGLYSSAAALLRVQYESLVRAIWVLYVAMDSQAELMLAELTLETAKQASKIPMLSQMLEAIEEKAPHAPVAHLKEFKHYSWRPLSSLCMAASMQ